jgi:proton-dependent oligopeptide transporter, POT family
MSAYRTAPLATTAMPPGIPYIIANEFAERFSYYGMKAVLMLFMTQQLMKSDGSLDVMTTEQATVWIHNFGAAVYFTPLIGALLADLLWGKYKTIILLSLVYCAGHLILAFDSTRTGLFWGLALIAAGAGGIKPCVSAHVGDQFGTSNAHLLPRIYNWFYFSINLGATLSMLITPWLRVHFGPHWAFGVPGVLMVLATLLFWMGRRKFAHIPPEPRRFLEELKAPDFLRSLAGLAMIYCFVAMFWALFDQTSSRWVELGTRMNGEFYGITLLPDMMQSVNAVLILLFIPLFSLVIYPAAARFVTVTPLRKISVGFFVATFSFVIPAMIENWIAAGEKPSLLWQVPAYALITAAEVMISITCLEFSYSQAPKRLKSFVMSLYLCSVTLGNLFVANVNRFIVDTDGRVTLSGADYYWFFVKCMGITAVLFIFVTFFYKGRAYLQDESAKSA